MPSPITLSDLARAAGIPHDPHHDVLEYRRCLKVWCGISETYLRGPTRILILEEDHSEDPHAAQWCVQLACIDPDLDELIDPECSDVFEISDLIKAKAWVDAAPAPSH